MHPAENRATGKLRVCFVDEDDFTTLASVNRAVVLIGTVLLDFHERHYSSQFGGQFLLVKVGAVGRARRLIPGDVL